MKNTLVLIVLSLIVLAGCEPANNSKLAGTWIDKSSETGMLIIKQLSNNKFTVDVNGNEFEGTLTDETLEFTADTKVAIKYDVNDQLLIDDKHHWIRPEASRKNNYLGIWKHANFYNQPELVKGGFLRIDKDEKHVLKIEEGHIFKGELTPNTHSKFGTVVMQDSMLVGRRLIKEENTDKNIYNPQEITMKINSRGMLELTANGLTEKFQKKS